MPGADSLRDRILQAIEIEMARTESPHSKLAALEDKSLLRYADEMDLVERLPGHLFEASAAVCRAVCSQECGESLFHRSALCRCADAFDALINMSATDPESWGEVVAIDIDQQGKMMEMCSGLLTCRREPSSGCAAKAKAILPTSTAREETGGKPSLFAQVRMLPAMSLAGSYAVQCARRRWARAQTNTAVARCAHVPRFFEDLLGCMLGGCAAATALPCPVHGTARYPAAARERLELMFGPVFHVPC